MTSKYSDGKSRLFSMDLRPAKWKTASIWVDRKIGKRKAGSCMSPWWRVNEVDGKRLWRVEKTLIEEFDRLSIMCIADEMLESSRIV